VNKIQKGKAYPHEWKTAIVYSIYKHKEKVGKPNNYAVIPLLLVVGRIFSPAFWPVG
jgi:hypothetical protein